MRNGSVPRRRLTLQHTSNLEDVRSISTRRLPVAVNDFIEGGAEDEVTLRRNRTRFQSLAFTPRVLTDSGTRDQSTTILGTPVSSPIVLAPVGLAALAHPQGERAAALAAAEAGIISTLSSSSTWSLEEVAAATPNDPRWFQLYIWRERKVTEAIIERARAAGYRALAVTVDVQVAARRERDQRNGFEIPPRPTVRHAGDVIRHVKWFAQRGWDEVSGHGLTMGNFGNRKSVGRRVVMMEWVNAMFDPTVTWDDLDWLRSIWDGPLLIKGIMSAADARQAVSRGVDGVWVSNHGGRQLDGLPSTIEVLPEIVDVVDGRAEVFLDSGVRRGSDIVKAIALGARACMIGRPYVHGLGAGGQTGVERVIQHLTSEIDSTLALVGCPSVTALDRSYIRGVKERAAVGV